MKAEVQALLSKARQSLEAARLLQQAGYVDFAASRAYYAMPYAAEALLLDRGLTFSSHSAAVAAFGKLSAKTGTLDARYHRYLIDAQDTRNLPAAFATKTANHHVWQVSPPVGHKL